MIDPPGTHPDRYSVHLSSGNSFCTFSSLSAYHGAARFVTRGVVRLEQQYLDEFMRNHQGVKYLACHEITDSALGLVLLEMLASVMGENRSITSFSLSNWSKANSPPLDLRMIKQLTQALAFSSVQNLFFEGDAIDAKQLTPIANLLSTKGSFNPGKVTFLTKWPYFNPPPILLLDLSKNQLGTEGARTLAGALTANTSLLRLTLAENQLGDTAIECISGALAQHPSLVSLFLHDNTFGALGAHYLGKMLQTNTCLTRLELDRTKVGDAGCRALAVALKDNFTLQFLSMLDSHIGDAGLEGVTQILQTNTTLFRVKIANGNLDWSTENYQRCIRQVAERYVRGMPVEVGTTLCCICNPGGNFYQYVPQIRYVQFLTSSYPLMSD
jgi:hypothetical protein